MSPARVNAVVDARRLFLRRRNQARERLGGLISDRGAHDLRSFAADVVSRSRGDGPWRIRRAAAILGARDPDLAGEIVLRELYEQEIVQTQGRGR